MSFNIRAWVRDNYHRLISSIAFYPAVIALLFLVLSSVSIAFDFSEAGKHIKSSLQWLRLKDPSTARSIVASIAAGIISLTVFSFSMVMIVLNQTASQMSNRILDNLIGSRFQQIVLGVYVGTIVFALFLLSTIREVDSGIHIPALSTYLLIVLTICDIFLFIYFLHYITQAVKYDVIIRRIHNETLESMKSACISNQDDAEPTDIVEKRAVIIAARSGVYEGFNVHALLKLCEREGCHISILHSPGTFLMEGSPLAILDKNLLSDAQEDFQAELHIHKTESIQGNYVYGLRQLTEVAIKAMSPGINDPGTAVQVLRALFELYAYRISNVPGRYIWGKDKSVLIIKKELTIEEIFEQTLLPIWDYGKNDRMVCVAFQNLLTQLSLQTSGFKGGRLLKEVSAAISNQISL